MIEQGIVQLLSSFSAGVVLTLIVVYVIFKNPDKVKKWLAMFWEFVSLFWKKAEYLAIKNDIEGRVNSFVRSVETNTTTSFPRVKVHWIGNEEDEGLVWDEDEVIVVMRDRKHKTKNFVHATYIFTSETLLNRSKRHLSKKQKKSLDLYATQQILKDEYPSALEQFMNDYIVPNLTQDDDLRLLIKQFEKIQELGVFFPILVQELSTLGSKVFLEKPNQEIIVEVNDLIKFLENFSQREVGDTSVEETFRGKYTRCTIKIVASKATRDRNDVELHASRIRGSIHEACENIYVIGSAKIKNWSFMNKVCRAVHAEHEDLITKKQYRFSGKIFVRGKKRSVKTYLVHLHNPHAVQFFVRQEQNSTS